MGDIARAVRRPQRQGDAPGSDSGVATSRRRKHLLQEPDRSSTSRATMRPPARGQEISGVENDLTGDVGMDDASARIDKAYSCAQAVSVSAKVAASADL